MTVHNPTVRGDEIETALLPWDGRWMVARPAGYVAGLHRMHQLVAHSLLKERRRDLTNWSARFLQGLVFQGAALTDTQAFWLARIEKELEGRAV